MRVDPLDSDVVWAATTDGVYKSEDAGASWSRKFDVVRHYEIRGDVHDQSRWVEREEEP